ncbi:pyridoxamine 5'-phosphate oxidase, partial [Lecanoromycetidae sp. Uapishka_2]
MCNNSDGANRFLAKIIESYADVTHYSKEQLEAVQDTLVLEAMVQERLDTQDFSGALKLAEERLSQSAQDRAMARICAMAADHGDSGVAGIAYHQLAIHGYRQPSPVDIEVLDAAFSMLALSIRQGDVIAARGYWSLLSSSARADTSFVEPTALYAIALVQNGFVEEGLSEARESFGRIRGAAGSAAEVTEQIDEAIESIGAFMAKSGIVPSANASTSFLWAMIENGGLVSPVAEQLLAGLGPEDINGLSLQDMMLALQVEAGLLGNGQIVHDIAHSARFDHLLDIAITSGTPLDERTTGLIEKALGKLANERPDIVNKWQSRQQNLTQLTAPTLPSSSQIADTYDPYAANTDFRGSTIIVELLEKRRNNAGLNEALTRFRNIRLAGRHPRYIVYAKLITAASKEGRVKAMDDIYGTAETDFPFMAQYAVVRQGWSSILDAMAGACLTVNDREKAAIFHQKMLDIGAAPSANTFGLYITTLKESTKTFDEASEAVAIFRRAMAEGVVPTSFLYNALIGKLGKARRIDDVLRFFQEMRGAGIHPTSVTYGTIINALCRVSDGQFAEELFDEMESMPNYKPRPAPYNTLMQFCLTTKRDSQKVLAYYERMQTMNIEPTMHTYKLLVDTYATLEPFNLAAAEGVLDNIRASGQRPEAKHYSSLIHAKGCVFHDMAGARGLFDEVLASGEIRPQDCLYQALFESMVANHCVSQTDDILASMSKNGVNMTPYIANTLIHGWAMENDIAKSKAIYDSVGTTGREPSTYDAMTRAFLTVQDRDGANSTVLAPAGSKTTQQADQYTKGTLERHQLSPSPFTQFHTWFTHARNTGVHQPETVCLSTAHLPSGSVSSRYVYLKELDSTGFVVYSNWGTSRKAADVESNPRASLAFWWHEVERQVRVEGKVERLTARESQAYYELRARGSRIGAWASEQSNVLPEEEGARAVLDRRVRDVEKRFEGVEDIPVPDFWGGLRVLPDMVEFWQGRESRLHDRFRYLRDDGAEEGGGWKIERLSP